ncbi:ATP-binding protein [Tenacibaculum maritimum]|uniref:ATPase AAA-type core domain-containing protein n=1 Tax=Tenacibaculum maritimum NCIMB 2154 TaxID=1349785 RepID=A0A2H1E6J3_9FLAO|nr:ATP-binding protein [Tenacibaculum maritimum]SFZ80257.1 conserved protein of unknown function [Tenacibaculum maritimum NCIMB 2154]
MRGFRLLAIRPLIDCDEVYLKGLDPNGIFSFYSNYNYLNKKGESVKNNEAVEKIIIEKDDSFNIYREEINKTSINISALVGRNGSGKSTLLELFYVTCFAIALEKGIIPDNTYYHKKYLEGKEAYLQEIIDNIQRVQMWLRAEIIYAIDSDFFSVSYFEGNLIHKHIQGNNSYPNFKNKIYKNNSAPVNKYVFNEAFFYSIVTNYSLYGLNSINQGHWLQSLFHKNDGYQTPLVITPMRTKGIIDINDEFHFAQTRLLSNLVDENFKTKNIVNNKKAESIVFELDTERFTSINNVDIDLVHQKYIKEYKLSNGLQYTDEKFFIDIYNALNREKKLRIKEIDIKAVPHFNSLIKYILRKLIRISLNYKEYNEFYFLPKDGKPIPSLREFRKLLLKLQNDNSHIVLKLRQILNAIRFNIFKNSKTARWKPDDSIKNNKKFTYSLKTEEFVSRIKAIKKEFSSIELIEIIPAAAYLPYLKVEKNKKGEGHIFESLSSGEQQFAHSLHSIYYHLLNVNSVFKSDTKKIKYSYVNIILDEIELYYHPDFQKKYIRELLNGLKNLKLDYIKGINLIFSTHSPFILSDIPANNILRLQEGQVYKEDIVKSFGANIHDILADDFFLSNGFIGDFAKEKIDKVIGWLNYKILKNQIKSLKDEIVFLKKEEKKISELKYKILEGKEKELETYNEISDISKDYCKSLIEIIDEPLLNNTLNDMYHIAYPKTENEKLEEVKAFARKLGVADKLNDINKQL